MKVPRSAGSAQRNWVYYTDAQQQYVINSVPGEASQNTGDPIHFSGYRHLGVDGEMLDVDICWWNDTPGNPLVCGAKASTEMYGNPITLLSGDSGGPLFYSGAALGISSSVASGVVYYSFVTRAEDELNVSICITQACGI